MWLLSGADNPQGDPFDGKKIWLRPGRKYTLGRSSTSNRAPGQLYIDGPSVSRKHLTIEITQLPEDQITDLQGRAKVTIEDLDTKVGTYVNDKKVKGERFDLLRRDNEIKLGKGGKVATLRISWFPVVLDFNFSKDNMHKEGPIRAALEPLDIRSIYGHKSHGDKAPTHLVSTRKNNPRVIEALNSCKYVVNLFFVDAIVAAAASLTDEHGAETSLLEQDFEANWPDATKFIPPVGKGDDAAFAPDERRREIFDGYTFIFYDLRTFVDNSPAITSGKGKALYREVVPGKETVDDFVRYVKTTAGEKGLGEFEDGSEGRGVVVVRHTPSVDDNAVWWRDFFTEFALRLDHRPIAKGDFLSAVLDLEPEQLRRPLELEPTPQPSSQQNQEISPPADNNAMEVDNPLPSPPAQSPPAPNSPEVIPESPSPSPSPVLRPRKGRSQAKSRFQSFNIDSDSDSDNAPPPAGQHQQNATAKSQGMFMTQQSDIVNGRGQVSTTTTTVVSQRKRPAPPPEAVQRELIDSVAPTAARVKRRRLETGEDSLPAIEKSPTPESDEATPAPTTKKGATKKPAARKGKKGAADDEGEEHLNQLIQTGQAEEAARQAEDDLLRRQLFEGEIDLSTIRAGTHVKVLTIRRKPPAQQATDSEAGGDPRGATTAEAEAAERWNPHWNGRKNFKRFRSQTEQQAQAAAGPGQLLHRVARGPVKRILQVAPVHHKEYGLSDDYWLQDGGGKTKKKPPASRQTQQTPPRQQRAASSSRPSQRGQVINASSETDEEVVEEDAGGHFDDEDDDDDASLPDVMDMPPQARSRRGKVAERTSQKTTTNKRPAAKPPAAEKPAKRSKTAAAATSTATRARSKEVAVVLASDDDDSDEDGGGAIGFRFGKRK